MSRKINTTRIASFCELSFSIRYWLKRECYLLIIGYLLICGCSTGIGQGKGGIGIGGSVRTIPSGVNYLLYVRGLSHQWVQIALDGTQIVGESAPPHHSSETTLEDGQFAYKVPFTGQLSMHYIVLSFVDKQDLEKNFLSPAFQQTLFSIFPTQLDYGIAISVICVIETNIPLRGQHPNRKLFQHQVFSTLIEPGQINGFQCPAVKPPDLKEPFLIYGLSDKSLFAGKPGLKGL